LFRATQKIGTTGIVSTENSMKSNAPAELLSVSNAGGAWQQDSNPFDLSLRLPQKVSVDETKIFRHR